MGFTIGCLSAEPFKIAILPVLALAPKARCPLGDIMCCDVTILTVMTSNSISLIFCASTITDTLIACWTKTSYCQHRPRPVSSISYATAQKNLRQAAIWNLWLAARVWVDWHIPDACIAPLTSWQNGKSTPLGRLVILLRFSLLPVAAAS